MTIQDWGSIGELLGAIAVFVSLLYLAIQVRQNTASERSSMVSAIGHSLAEFTSQLSQDQNLIGLHVRGLAEAELPQEARLRWDFLMLSVMRKLENAYAQHRLGIVTKAEWLGWSRPILGILCSPGGERWWQEWQGFMNDAFRGHVNHELESGKIAGLSPDHPVSRAVRAALDAERGAG